MQFLSLAKWELFSVVCVLYNCIASATWQVLISNGGKPWVIFTAHNNINQLLPEEISLWGI